MQLVLMKIAAIRHGQRIEEKEISRIKTRTYWFIAAFLATESAILSLKGHIYMSSEQWSKTSIGATQISFYVLHFLRIMFPVTLMVKFNRQITLYLDQVNDLLSDASIFKTKVTRATVILVMTVSSIWYNIVRPYYYVVHLKSQDPETSTDKYIEAVYYTTMVLNELNFCLLFGMACVVLSFARARFRRVNNRSRRLISTVSSGKSFRIVRRNSETSAFDKSLTKKSNGKSLVKGNLADDSLGQQDLSHSMLY